MGNPEPNVSPLAAVRFSAFLVHQPAVDPQAYG
jgi:hypothetical protein